MSDDEIIVQETPQDSNSPATFSSNIVSRFGIKSQKRGSETIDPLLQSQSLATYVNTYFKNGISC